MPFYSFNRLGAKVSQGLRNAFWLPGMPAGYKAVYNRMKQSSETECSEDLKRIDIPVLLIHGDDDQIGPIDVSARAAGKLLPNSALKVIPVHLTALPKPTAIS